MAKYWSCYSANGTYSSTFVTLHCYNAQLIIDVITDFQSIILRQNYLVLTTVLLKISMFQSFFQGPEFRAQGFSHAQSPLATYFKCLWATRKKLLVFASTL